MPTLSTVTSNNSMISTPSHSSIMNATDDGKIIKKKSKRSRKKKNSETKQIQADEKTKIKRRYSKVLTVGWY